jgi:urease accessory protein
MLFPLLSTLPHIAPGGNSAIEGFIHPFLGLDHLLAMVAVGLLSAQLGGRAIWSVPLTFVLVMAVGGMLGIVGIPLPAVEYGIAASVVVLGVALLARRRIPESIALLFVAIFALFHGHAHGEEIPRLKDSALYVIAYVLGFMSATAGLHVIGALLGHISLRSIWSTWLLRFSGVAIAVVGVYFLVNV